MNNNPARVGYTVGPGFARAARMLPYRGRRDEPLTRPLWIYSTDPADSKMDGSRVVINVPFETLGPGPEGNLFRIVGSGHHGAPEKPLDLQAPTVAVSCGVSPSTSYAFQMQMTYAVAMKTYETFRKALGRFPHWGFDSPHGQPSRLTIYPFDQEMNNAFYDRNAAAVRFGWFDAEDRPSTNDIDGNLRPTNLRRGRVYTSLSHDIVSHEVSHAIIDGLKPHYLKPLHTETLALHEGLSDLIAIFQHFSYRPLLEVAISRTQGNLNASNLLTDLARQFGQTQSSPQVALRTTVDYRDQSDLSSLKRYDPEMNLHQLGSVLVSSVFEAFATIYERKTRRYIKIATNGSGILPPGEISASLADVLAKAAADLAEQFLSICIRAVDYCPPVAATFCDYLRSMITADRDLVPSDPYGYREALIDSFARRHIPMADTITIDENSLVWPTVDWQLPMNLLQELERERLSFDAVNANSRQREARYMRRADALGRYLTSVSSNWHHLGLTCPGSDEAKQFLQVSLPCIESARFSRRVGPDGQLEQELIAEVTQVVDANLNGRRARLYQGGTLIVESDGQIRHAIRKRVVHYQAELLRRIHTPTDWLSSLWSGSDDRWSIKDDGTKPLHLR